MRISASTDYAGWSWKDWCSHPTSKQLQLWTWTAS